MYDVFSLKDFSFPKGFLWGSSVAGHQVEGMNIHSQNYYEEENGTRYEEKSGMACNHYNLYKEDVKLLKKLGHQAFRFSIEWSRIEPICGQFNENEVNHYADELRALKEQGIKAFVTLVHFTVPLWFYREGGFDKLENIKYFERYLKYLLPRVAKYVDYWNVFNEFNLENNTPERAYVNFNYIRFHALGYHLIKQYSSAPVSTAHALEQYYPYRPYDKFDRIMTEYHDWKCHEFFFHAIRTGEILFPGCDAFYDKDIKGTCDFWSINCYTRAMIDARKAKIIGNRYEHKQLEMVRARVKRPYGFKEMYPEGMFDIVNRMRDKPVIISENGCGCDDDRFRIVYLALHLSALAEAIRDGVDVRGYMHWSTMDVYEWGSYTIKLGLCSVNRETFERTPKPSAYFFKEIIENNGFTQEILRKYLTELPTLGK